ITQEAWGILWHKALQAVYRRVANIKAIRPALFGDVDDDSAIKQTSKYAVNSSDFLPETDEKNQEIVSDLA
ncbi:protein rep, partial [Staphylococcus aureus]